MKIYVEAVNFIINNNNIKNNNNNYLMGPKIKIRLYLNYDIKLFFIFFEFFIICIKIKFYRFLKLDLFMNLYLIQNPIRIKTNKNLKMFKNQILTIALISLALF